jgi:phosphoribosylaminoimidazolecarboxamide formyltransferase/IMP cyclohydrolase
MAVKKRALISVSDKRYITNFARDIEKLGYELYSTGGTLEKIRDAGIPVTSIEKLTNSKEILDGRVKTLHPAVHAGLLADRTNPEHKKVLTKKKFKAFDLVVVNFYPFKKQVKADSTSLANAIELIDIGGPTMVRAAAKNYRNIGVVTSIDQYREVIRHLKSNDGELDEKYRMRLARDAFILTAEYEAAIADYFTAVAPAEEETVTQSSSKQLAEILPRKLAFQLTQEEKLRYGENPHQEAARYSFSNFPSIGFRILQGKAMSYNNYLDAGAALNVLSAAYEQEYVACVVKHLNPCGIAVGNDPVKTYINAREADPKSAFGGIVALGYPVDLALAKELKKTFLEIIIAPAFDSKARDHLSSKKNLRLVEVSPDDFRNTIENSPKMAHNPFGIFLQSYDLVDEQWDDLQIASKVQPDEKLRTDILLGLKFIRFLKSNSLCVVKNGVMIGRGVGQMSRVDAAELAIQSAGKRRCKDAVLVSDGFFPFADSIELAAKAKFGCVVAPAGSKRDHEVVAEAEKLNIPLVFAPYRHFQH